MIINQTEGNVEIVGDVNQSTEMKIDEKSLQFLFKTFSDTLYSDKIGSIVREITSNCFDSHAEAGVNMPVIISLNEPNSENEYSGSIIFEDFGVGLSPERMENIFSHYFSSTKRDTNNQIGGFGIGSKSPLAYTNIYTIQTVYNNIEYVYLIHRGDAAPSIELINKERSEKRNGSRVIIPIKSSSDFNNFILAIKKQLKFFDNVVINHPRLANFNKDKILRGKHFIVRENDNSDNSGICIGKVNYPLNFNIIGEYYGDFSTPVCLLFDIGEIGVTLNREMIDYSEETIEKVKEKLKLAKEEIKGIIESQGNKYDDLLEYLQYRNLKATINVGDSRAPLEGFYNLNVPCEFTPLAHLPMDIPIDPFADYYIDGFVNFSNSFVKYKTHLRPKVSDCLKKGNVFRLTGKLEKKKTIYLYETFGKCLILKKYEFDSVIWNDYVKDKSSAERVESIIREFNRFVLKYVISKTESYDKIELPKTWVEEYKKTNYEKRKSIVQNKELILHLPGENKFDRQVTTFKNLDNFLNVNGFKLIYGTSQDDSTLKMLDPIICMLNDTANLKTKVHIGLPYARPYLLVRLSNENVKIIKDRKNAIHVNDFIKQNKKALFKAYYINELVLNTKKSEKIASKAEPFLKEEFFKRIKIPAIFYNSFRELNSDSMEFLKKYVDFNLQIDKPLMYKGMDIVEIYNNYQSDLKNLELLDLLDNEKIKNPNPVVYKMVEFALKSVNPKYYFYAKNFCNA